MRTRAVLLATCALTLIGQTNCINDGTNGFEYQYENDSARVQPVLHFWDRVNEYLDIKMSMMSNKNQVMVTNSTWIRVCDNFTESLEASWDLGKRFIFALRIDPTVQLSKALFNLLDCPTSIYEGTKCLFRSLGDLQKVLKPIIQAALPFAKEALKLIPEVADSYKACFYI